MPISCSRGSRLGPLLVAATATATVLVPAAPAAASWHSSSSTFIDYRDVCRDGIRFGGAVRDGAGPATGPYENRAVAAAPPPDLWANWEDRENEVMDLPISIPEDKTTIEVEGEGEVAVSHKGDFKMRYASHPLDLGPLALNLEDGNPQSTLAASDVTNCFLYAAIDVVPGKSSNQVPVGHGDIAVAALSSKIVKARDFTPSKFRFGPGKAKVKTSELRDVNGDHRLDLVMKFSSAKAHIKCSTKTAVLKGEMPEGGPYEGKDKVKPVGC